MPNEPPESTFKHKVPITAYPCAERGGMIWAYIGPAERQPAPPRFEWTLVPVTHRQVSKVIQETNWLQGLEGGVDTSHAPILHRLITIDSTRPGFEPTNPFVRGKAPVIEVDTTDYGYQYAGVRPLDEASLHVRTYHLILPFHQIRPSQTERGNPLVAGHVWVPMDDETTMVYNWEYSPTNEPLSDEDRHEIERRLGNGPHDVDQTTFHSLRNRQNNYLLDREVQRTKTYTGIDGMNTRIARSRRAWGRSSIAARSTSVPPIAR